jgi:hypothetical protein
MMAFKIKREFYSLTEAAEIICCSVADLIHLAARGDIRFIVLTSGLPALRIKQKIINRTMPFEAISDKFCYVRQDSIAIFEADHSSDLLYVGVVHTDEGLENGWLLDDSSAIPMAHESLYMLTTDINALRNDQPATEGAEKQQVNVDVGNGKVNAKSDTLRTRTTNLKRAINQAVKDIGHKPSFEVLWRYFHDDKDKSGFIEDYTDKHLVWRDTKGTMHDTDKETIRNHLSAIKS